MQLIDGVCPMNEIKQHTPGPWTLETVNTSVGICHKIGPFPSNSGIHPTASACVYADNIRMDDVGHSKVGDELLANARLIAAAPDLLAVVKALDADWSTEGDPDAPNWPIAESTRGIWKAARAAIAKAEGRS